MIIDGDVQGFPASELWSSATSSVAPHDDLLKTRHAFDIEVQQVTGGGMFITHGGRSRMQIAPATEMGAPQDAAHGGGTESGGLSDLVSRAILPAQCEDLCDRGGRSTAWPMPRTGRAVQQTSRTLGAVSAGPFGDRFRHPSQHVLHQRFSTTQRKSGILVDEWKTQLLRSAPGSRSANSISQSCSQQG